MDGHMFDNLICGTLPIGIAIELALAGIACGIWWIYQHLSVSWAWA